MLKWLKCSVSKGMFSDELTVFVKTSCGDPVSVFVPKAYAEAESGRVKVRVADDNRHFVVLPNDLQTVIDVNPADLMPA